MKCPECEKKMKDEGFGYVCFNNSCKGGDDLGDGYRSAITILKGNIKRDENDKRN